MSRNDLYRNYAELADREREGTDYRLKAERRESPVAIIAPHGGKIERWTSELAADIAGDSFSLYCFEGIRRDSGELHITSHNFDEPTGVALVEASEIAVGIHGRSERGDPEAVWLGGLNRALRAAMASELTRAGFQVLTTGHPFPAEDPNNICNRGRGLAGVQLELPMPLRDALFTNHRRLHSFVGAVRRAIKAHIERPHRSVSD